MADLLLPDSLTWLAAGLLITANFFATGFTATFGIGGGLMMIAALGYVLPSSDLIAVHGAILLFSNASRAWHLRAAADLAIMPRFMIASLVGIALGAWFVVELPQAALLMILGGFVLLSLWFKVPGIKTMSQKTLLAGSSIIGFLTMFVGATGPLLIALFAPFYAGNRQQLVGTHATGMVFHHGMKIVAFALAGFAFAAYLPMIITMAISGFFGAKIGVKFLSIMPEDKFRTIFKWGLSLVALDMMRRGFVAAF